MIIPEQTRPDITLLKRGVIIRKVNGGKDYWIISASPIKYGDILIKATDSESKVGKSDGEFQITLPSYDAYELVEEEELIKDGVVDSDVKVENIFEKKNKDDDWTEEELEEAKKRVMQKAALENKIEPESNVAKLFKTKEQIELEKQHADSVNGDLFAISNTVQEVKQEVKQEVNKSEDWGEITDYKSNLKQNEVLIRVIHTDSLNSNKYGLKSLPSKAFDCAIVDPPYGMAFRSNTRKKENRHLKIENDDNVDFVPDFLKQLNRVTKDDAFVYIFFSHHYIDFIISEAKKVFGDGYKGILVWEKNNTTAGDLDVWGSQTEFILFIKKGSKSLTQVRDGNVLKFSKVISDNHPTEKPLDLIQYLLFNSCNPGEMVLDCFAGSGVLAEAALYVGVNCVVMEYEKKYYDYICYRVSEALKRPKLLMDAFSDGIDNRTDKYIKIMEASYEQKFKDEIKKFLVEQKELVIKLLCDEVINGNKEVIPHLIKFLENVKQ